MRRSLKTLVASAALLIFPLVTWAQSSTATKSLSPDERAALTPSRTTLNQGWDVANRACANCHGLDGASTGPGVPNLAGQRTVYLHRMLRDYQERERRNDDMNHAVGLLNEDALLAVSAYYASLAPARSVLAEDEPPVATDTAGGDPFAGIRDDMKKCVKCHGEDGNSSASGMPNLSSQAPEYFVASMKSYVEGSRDHKLMTKLAANLDDETLGKMGVFYAVQEPGRTETTGDGNVDLGRELAEPCASCHGPDGNASGAEMPTLAGQDARYFVKAMQAYKTGKRQYEKMFDAVEALSETDIANLASFYAVQEPVRRNVRTPLTTMEWIARCERCHGTDGNSTDPRFPMLAGQEPGYLRNALQSYAGKARTNSAMHAMSSPLSAADIEQMVSYYSTREPKAVVYIELPCEEQADE